MIQKIRRLVCQVAVGKPEFLCLAFLLGLEFLLMAFGTYGLYFIDNFTILPCMLFMGIAMTKKHTPGTRRLLGFCLLWGIWFLVTQVAHFATDLQSRPFGVFLSVALLAFPFAAVAEDSKKQFGLKLAGFAYLAAALVLTVLTAMLYLEAVPGFLRPHVYWYGSRLYAMAHPNIVASILMIGCGFSLSFLGLCKKRWQKLFWLAVYLLLLATMSLTNSRTTIYMTLAMSACFAFFYMLQPFCWKRLAAAVLVMVIAGAGLLMYTEMVQDTHTAYIVSLRLQQEAAQGKEAPAADQANTTPAPAADQADTAPAPTQTPVTDEKIQAIEKQLISSGGQGNLQNDLRTLNGRTTIWASVLQSLRDEPIRMVWGTDYSEPLLITYPPYRQEHCHNAWLETLLCMGVPGLVFALILTVLAAWKIAATLLSTHFTMWEKGIALLMLFLLGASMLEPYLFLADRYYQYTNVIFFLCLGYAAQWRKA